VPLPAMPGLFEVTKGFRLPRRLFLVSKAQLFNTHLTTVYLLVGFRRYPPRPPWVFPDLAAHIDPKTDITDSIKDIINIINGLKRLTPELLILLASYCPESPLWRYSVVSKDTRGE
jgi:hypothetical protein